MRYRSRSTSRYDDALRLEGQALDVIHELQRMRRDAGLEIVDRIVIGRGPELDDVFGAHGERIADETLAVRVERVAAARLSVAKA